ncbi:hypothetical protein P7K49_029050 [Saguinus oedipus]|uniref:Uncharacterized protein n=1 Tax=Saguinus oedipus TaxID=9490 RepID=A0ABQ9U632_SAGOE|nr:hypothetical protein P7K49_029050 [Saguinus oedipus]
MPLDRVRSKSQALELLTHIDSQHPPPSHLKLRRQSGQLLCDVSEQPRFKQKDLPGEQSSHPTLASAEANSSTPPRGLHTQQALPNYHMILKFPSSNSGGN